jgi:trigger factor
VRENLEREEQVRTRREVEGTITDELIRRNAVDLPPRLVEYMLERVLREATEGKPVDEALRSELEQRYRPGVERSLRREVLLDAIARQEGIEATDDEVAVEIDRLAQSEPRQAARIRAHYQSAERRSGLKETLKERKALEKVVEAARFQDETVPATPLIVPATR